MSATVVLDARDAFAPQLRGWGRYTACLLDALRAAAPADLSIDAVERGGGGPEVLFEQFGLPRELRRRDADLVHAPNCFLPLRRPCPGVVTVHDLAFEAYPGDFAPRTRVKYRRLARAAARSAERVICDGAYTKGDLARRWGVDPGRVRVVPLAAALPHAHEPLPEGDPYLLAVGDLRAKKNLTRLVRAYARLRREGLRQRLVLAGLDGGEAGALRDVAGGEPLELTGYVTDSRLDALIRGADLLVHPSLYEGFGFVVLEAMERGTPVAIADATSLPEVAGAAAVRFDPEDVDAIAAGITSALSRADELRAAGSEHAASFSWEATAAATLDVYREALA